jgi:hypothetical protein
MAPNMQKPGIVNADTETPQDVSAEPQGEPMASAPEEQGQVAGAIDKSQQNPGPEVPTKEEQDVYDKVVLTAMQLMYSKDGFSVMMQKIASGKENVAKSIGHTAAMIALSVQNGVRKKENKEVPLDIMFNAMAEILEQVLDAALKAGFISQEHIDDITNASMMAATKVYGNSEIQSGHITPMDMTAAQKTLQQAGMTAYDVSPDLKEKAAGVASQIAQQGAPQQGAPQGAAPMGQPPPQGGGIINQQAGV